MMTIMKVGALLRHGGHACIGIDGFSTNIRKQLMTVEKTQTGKLNKLRSQLEMSVFKA